MHYNLATFFFVIFRNFGPKKLLRSEGISLVTFNFPNKIESAQKFFTTCNKTLIINSKLDPIFTLESGSCPFDTLEEHLPSENDRLFVNRAEQSKEMLFCRGPLLALCFDSLFFSYFFRGPCYPLCLCAVVSLKFYEQLSILFFFLKQWCVWAENKV